MITEDYVSLKTAKLLKEKGFKEWCRQCYGIDVRHNGKSISIDEEYELKDTGRENEIEYVDGGIMYEFGCSNFYPSSPYAAPTLYVAMKWLRETHKLCISIAPQVTDDDGDGGCLWQFAITSHLEPLSISLELYEQYEEACEAAIKYCLENLI